MGCRLTIKVAASSGSHVTGSEISEGLLVHGEVFKPLRRRLERDKAI